MTNGLSPPTRGNRVHREHADAARGSIPAHAGEPRRPSLASTRREVYPRPRGGTTTARRVRSDPSGLSPPTRGNPVFSLYVNAPVRSIPAHAGEPCDADTILIKCRVYPRPRGGTAAMADIPATRFGLSPPTRGNPGGEVPALPRVGSIPAHAGEPSRSPRQRLTVWVYPRPRGGTAWAIDGSEPTTGLSPPTRGNRRRAERRTTLHRSIPAHAGEPAGRAHIPNREGVYPRPRGGTAKPMTKATESDGLSPPTRGNRPPLSRSPPRFRSIPAHAGEPNPRIMVGIKNEVYPRPRGGTLPP